MGGHVQLNTPERACKHPSCSDGLAKTHVFRQASKNTHSQTGLQDLNYQTGLQKDLRGRACKDGHAIGQKHARHHARKQGSHNPWMHEETAAQVEL